MRRLLSWVGIAVLMVSGFFLADHYFDIQGRWNQAMRLEHPMEAPPNENDDVSAGETAAEAHPYRDDLLKWHRANGEVKAWLDIQRTGISLPVVQHADNIFYMSHDATGAANQNGAAFIDYEVADLAQADHVIIYGHNMENGQVFSDLVAYRDASYARAHPDIRLATPEALKTYEVLLVADMDLTDEASFFSFNSWLNWGADQDAEKYVEEMRKRAVYDSGLEVAPEDRLLSLSTCENSRSNARCIIVAKGK